MKKTVAMGLAAAAVLNASGIDGAFEAGKAGGQLRAAYIANDSHRGGNDYATAVGGTIRYETAAWKGLRGAAAVYASHKTGFATGEGEQTNLELLDEEGKSYAYVGEAYIDYSTGGLGLRVGRQLLDTPFADTDDIRMHPNTFEAVVARYGGLPGTTVTGGYIARWAGYDSGDDKTVFKKMAGEGSEGASVIGITNETIEGLALQGWYYRVDRLADIRYADAVYGFSLSGGAGVELSVQYARMDERSGNGLDGEVCGAGVMFDTDTLTVGAAYNRVGKSVTNGFGGGPYLSSMEEWTLEGMSDARAYRLSAEMHMEAAGIDGLSLTAQYGVFKSDTDGTEVDEFDLIAVYELSEKLSADVSYAVIDDRYNNAEGGTDAGYSRFLARISYNF